MAAGESHRAFFGLWNNPATNLAIDEVVLIHHAVGRGFTGEASVEIICHGGRQVTDLVLEAALAAGCRLARPGEFTYRAVMNGKLDLALRAESVLSFRFKRKLREQRQKRSTIFEELFQEG